MKCPKCGGKGIYNHVADYYVRCNKCNGTGEIEQTEEEWFASLTTEEKAKWIAKQCHNTLIEYAKEQALSRTNYKFWVNVLKEVHKE